MCATIAKWFRQFLCLASFRLKREKVCDPDCAQSISMSSSVWPWITDIWPKLKPTESWWNLLTKKNQIKNSAMIKYLVPFLSYLGIRAKVDQGIRISVLHAAKAPIRLSRWEWDWSYITLSMQGITPANGKATFLFKVFVRLLQTDCAADLPLQNLCLILLLV